MKEKCETVYVKAERNSICREPQVKIQDVMSVQCSDPAICAGIKNKTFYSFEKKETSKKKRIEVFSILKIIELIQNDYPQVEVVSYGEQDFVVEYIDRPPAPRWLEYLKVVAICGLIFLGSAFTIMAFNNDISIGEVFDRFYGQIMGTDKPNVTEIKVGSCLGLAGGVVVFDIHMGQKRRSSDPTPIQVEMRKYEKDVDTAFIENAGRKGHEHDVS